MTTKKSQTNTKEVVNNEQAMMHSEEEFRNELPKLYLIDSKDIKDISMPVNICVQEGKDLGAWCKADIPELLKLGIAKEYLTSLIFRSELLQWPQSEWLKDRFNREEDYKEWLIESKSAYELHDKLLHAFNFAYRNNPEVLRRVKIISKGHKHADMLQDLSDIAVIGREFSKELKIMNFDMSLLDSAEEKARTLGTVLAKSRAGETNNGAKELRDRAYTYLKIAVDEVRAGGQHLFYHNEDRLRGYRSKYIHQQNAKRKKSILEDVI